MLPKAGRSNLNQMWIDAEMLKLYPVYMLPFVLEDL